MKSAIISALVFLLIAAAYVPVWLEIVRWGGDWPVLLWCLFVYVNVAIVCCAAAALIFARRVALLLRERFA